MKGILRIFIIGASMAASLSCAAKGNYMEMSTMQNTYYGLEEDSKGGMANPELDAIPGLLHKEIIDSGYNNADGVKYQMFAEFYIDGSYPKPEIRRLLFKETDRMMFDGFWIDCQEGDSAFWANKKPYLKATVEEFCAEWSQIMGRLSHRESALPTIAYDEIWPAMSYVLCHIVYEDDRYVTYILESGNSGHGGNGCRNRMDYLTFDLETGKLLTAADFFDLSNKTAVNEAINLAYSADPRRQDFGDEGVILDIEEANGVALLNEGIVVYFYPYTIGCGAEGQYNLIIDKSTH